MKCMTGNEIRKAYLDFFESKKHLKLHSFSLVPENDPSLLLIGAGMNLSVQVKHSVRQEP